MRARSLTLALALLTVASASAQDTPSSRYDLGQRLRMMDQAWETAAPENRAKAVVPLNRAVANFLAGRGPEAANALDTTRLLLNGFAEPTPVQRWANSLIIRPGARFADAAMVKLPMSVAPYYDPHAATPPGARLDLRARTVPDTVLGSIPIRELPVHGEVGLARLGSGDHWIDADIVVDNQSQARFSFLVSIVPDLKRRMSELASAVQRRQEATLTGLTLGSLYSLLCALATNETLETNYPAARLLEEAEALAKLRGDNESYYGCERSGEFWLTVPTPAGTVPVRLFVPQGLKRERPTALVVALHGLGGSENLFFDAYGNGLTVAQCRERGWLMVAPRAGGLLDGIPPVGAIVDELSRAYPVDRERVFVLGHSMGAGHTIGAIQQNPGRFAAAAALGGGGNVQQVAAVKDLPVFVAVGSADFLLGAAKALAGSLTRAGARTTFKEYRDIEHMAILPESIPEIFSFFDRVRAKRPASSR